MKKFFLLMAGLLFSLSSQATILTVNFNDAVYQKGNSLAVDVVLSDQSESFNAFKLLSGFNLDFGFNSNILNFKNLMFGDRLSPFGASLQNNDATDAAKGVLKISEDSFEDASDLLSVQDGLNRLVLATINFDIVGTGVNVFSLTNSALVEANSNRTLDSFTAVQRSLTVADVPEPSPLVLMLFAGIALFYRNKAIHN